MTRLGLCVTRALATAVLAFSPSALAQGGQPGEEPHEEKKGGGPAADIGLDLSGAAILTQPRPSSGNSLAGGGGLKARLGGQFRAPFVRVTPEVGYGYMHVFTTNEIGSNYDWNTHQLFGGIRLGIGEIVTPTLYGHVGYGWRVTHDPTIPDANGVAFDVGFALDVRIIPHFDLGAHVEYAMIDSRPYVPQWVAMGLHADLVF
jgi:hypothetical protein